MKDYAFPTMRAERCLKDLHDAVLSKQWDKAKEKAEEAFIWLADVREAVQYMRERDEA